MRKRRILSLVTALALCLTLLPTVALAGEVVKYLDANGDEKECTSATKVTESVETWNAQDPNNGWYVVNDSNVTITSRIAVTGDVHLILADNCTLNAPKGIYVGSGASLTIYGQSKGDSAGTLNAGSESSTPEEGCAGIGGNSDVSAANSAITINGGKINAYGGENGAGIGGGANETEGTRSITINGGTVYAKGGEKAAGIGSGYTDPDFYEMVRTIGPIKITKSAKVTAKGGLGAAGIGGSYQGKPTGQITISGNAEVDAAGGTGGTLVRAAGAGIGGGGDGKAGNIVVLITGGTVKARGSSIYGGYSAGIGSGGRSKATPKITISGGTVTATTLQDKCNSIGAGEGSKNTGTFSTNRESADGTPVFGNAVIYAYSIGDKSNQANWNGIIFTKPGGLGPYNGTVYGDVTLNKDFTLEVRQTLTVPKESSLTVAARKTFTVATEANLIVEEGGELVNNGTITNSAKGTVTIKGTLTGNGIAGEGTTTVWYTVTVAAEPAKGGTVTVAPEDAAENGQYESGTEVTVTAAASTGYHFVRWTENGEEVSTDSSYTFAAAADRSLTAVFAADTPTHTHEYGENWSCDETGHWKECTVSDCPYPDKGKTSVEAHTYDNAADASCNVCGYERTVPYFIATLTVGDTTTYYETVGAAIDAANKSSGGGTVKLLGNATLTGGTTDNQGLTCTYIREDIILDLGGYTLEYGGNAGFAVNPNVKFTIQHGTYRNTAEEGYGILATKGDYDGPGCTIIVAQDAIIEAYDGIVTVGHTDLKVYGTIRATGNAIFGSGPQNEVLVENAELISKKYGIYQEHRDGGSSYTIKNSEITVDSQEGWAIRIGNEEENIADYDQGMQTLEIKNSTITGANGIYVEYTDVTVSGDETWVNAPKGYALAVFHRDGEKTLGKLSITGGTFDGKVYIEPDEGKETATATLTISGGQFTDNVSEYVEDGMMQDEEGNIVGKIPAESIALDETDLNLYVGDEKTLTATVAPDNATDTIEWSSNKSTVATVDQNGTVTAVGEGTATITAKAGDMTATCEIVVTRRECGISAAPSELDFGNAYPAYQQPGAQTVTITNTGNQPLTLTQPAAADWLVVGELSETALSPDETATFTVQPKADLPVGTYSTTITITGSGSNDDVSTDVTVSFAVVERPVSSGGTAPVRDITVDSGSHGDVEIWPEEAKQGTTVTITADPDKGYEVAEVIVTDEKGKEITVIDKGNNKYTFMMPNSDVTIEVTFQAVSGGSVSGGDLTITAPAGWVNPYSDVAANAWYYNAVGYASANGLMGGVGNNAFAPSGTMNRAMVWTVIARLAGQTISGESWAADAQAWAVAQGVSDGTNPDDSVTREELVTMLYRYAGSPAMNVPELGLIGNYPDSAAVSAWAQNAFAWAISQGIIEGRDGKLAAGDSITRAEAATILARFHLLTK